MNDVEWRRVEGAVLVAWEDLPTEAILRGWREWLSEYPAHVVIDAIQKLAEEGNPYRPKIGEIVKACQVATLGTRPTFGEFLEEARANAHGARWESIPSDFEWSHPTFPGIMSQIGWVEFMNSDPDDRAPLLARMRRIFDDAMDRGDFDVPALPAPEEPPVITDAEFQEALRGMNLLESADAIGKIEG